MNVNLLLSIFMVVVGAAFLALMFLLPGEVTIGAFMASLAIAAFLFLASKKCSEWHLKMSLAKAPFSTYSILQ